MQQVKTRSSVFLSLIFFFYCITSNQIPVAFPSPFCYPGICMDFPGGSDGKASVYNAGDLGLIPGSGRFPREGNGNPLQDSCLENPMDGGAWCPWGHKEVSV